MAQAAVPELEDKVGDDVDGGERKSSGTADQPSFAPVASWRDDTQGAFSRFIRRPILGGLTPGILLIAFVLPSLIAAALVLWTAPSSPTAAPTESVATDVPPPPPKAAREEPTEAVATARASDEMPDEILRKAVGVGTGGGTIRIRERGLWGSGEIKGRSARMEKVLFTSSEGSTVWKHCAYIVYTLDPEWQVWEHVLVGRFEKSVETGECGDQGICAGGGGVTFRQCLTQAGYIGPIPGSGTASAPPGKTAPTGVGGPCPESRIRSLFISTCVGLFSGGLMESRGEDPRTFCNCAADHVDYKKLRKLDVCAPADRFHMNGLELQLVIPLVRSSPVTDNCSAP